MVYRVFDSSIKKCYQTSICSKATVFYVISTILSILLPFLICFNIQGFWVKHQTYREKPYVYFKHEIILNIETNFNDKPIIWTTFPIYNTKMNQYFRPIMTEHFEEDLDQDGRNDNLKLNITVPLKPNEEITSVKLLLTFQYQIYSYSRFEMESIALIQYSSEKPGSKLIFIGDLRIYQKEALHQNRPEFKYNKSIINMEQDESLNIENILNIYSNRNVTTALQNVYTLWKTPRASNQPFKIQAEILYPEETFLYKLSFWQLIKWGWVQYFSLLAVAIYFCYKIKVFVYENQVFRTTIESPLKKYI